MAKEQSGQEMTMVDGSMDWSSGANSYLCPTVASESNPNGLKRNALAWMNNCTVRGGGITQRPSWKKLGALPPAATGLYQGSFMYEPDSEAPYIIASIGGHIWKLDPDNPSSGIDLSLMFSTQSAAWVASFTDQVVIIATNNGPGGAGTVVAAGTNAVIGSYQSFMRPAIGATVRIATLTPYTGALLTVITIGADTYTINAIDGFAVTVQPSTLMLNPASLSRSYFCQAENFLVIQAGDLVTLPLIWDGLVLRRSLGLSGGGTAPVKTQDMGLVVWGFSSGYTFYVPPYLGVSNITCWAPYVGNIGDYIMLAYGTSDAQGHLLSYPYALLIGWVTAIAGSLIHVQWFYKTSTVNWNSYLSSSATLLFTKLTIVSSTPASGSNIVTGTPEIPTATAMDYFMGRLWYAQGRQYSAGDIVGNQSSGTSSYHFRDSVLKVTENPLCIGGDGFTVPTNSGNIRAIKHSANINTALGEGQLFIFTRRSIYSLTVPVTRTDWIGADNNNQPRQTVVQITNGSVNDRSVVEQNGDLFYQSFEPSIRSLVLAIRYYDQWGNTPISINEDRILKFNNRGLMQFASGVSFDNRTLQLVLPEECPVGVMHRAVVPLNFDVISTLENKLPPVWEGMYEGVAFLELLTGDFGGRQRCIAPIWSEKDRNIQLWEITQAGQFEKEDERVVWYVEFPAFTWGDEFMMKKLVSAELWIDRLYGEVMFAMDYRPDGDPCWYEWHKWKECTARNSCEDINNVHCVYPRDYCESFRQTMVLPVPPNVCERVMGRPANQGFQFQCRLTIKGFCRIRGLLLKAEKMEQQLYGSDMVC